MISWGKTVLIDIRDVSVKARSEYQKAYSESKISMPEGSQ